MLVPQNTLNDILKVNDSKAVDNLVDTIIKKEKADDPIVKKSVSDSNIFRTHATELMALIKQGNVDEERKKIARLILRTQFDDLFKTLETPTFAGQLIKALVIFDAKENIMHIEEGYAEKMTTFVDEVLGNNRMSVKEKLDKLTQAKEMLKNRYIPFEILDVFSPAIPTLPLADRVYVWNKDEKNEIILRPLRLITDSDTDHANDPNQYVLVAQELPNGKIVNLDSKSCSIVIRDIPYREMCTQSGKVGYTWSTGCKRVAELTGQSFVSEDACKNYIARWCKEHKYYPVTPKMGLCEFLRAHPRPTFPVL